MAKNSPRSIAEYAEHISIPGSANITSSNRLKRYSWMITIILAILFLSYQLLLVIQEFQEYRLNTVVKNHAYGFQFPDVTICKLHPFSVKKNPDRDLGIVSAMRFWKFAMNWTNGTSGQENTAFAKTYLSFWKFNQEYDLVTDIFEHIHFCNYNLRPCDPADFKKSSHPQRANCITFSPKDRNFIGTEIHRGLNMIFSNGNSFMPKYPLDQFSLNDGYEVRTHEKGTIFQVDKESVVIRPWSYVNLFLTMTNYTRFNTPLNECKTEKVLKHLFSHAFYGFSKGKQTCFIRKTLSDEDCLDFIETAHIYSHCRCFDDRKQSMCDKYNAVPKCHSLPKQFFYNHRIDSTGTLWYRNETIYLPTDRKFKAIVKRANCFDRNVYILNRNMNVSRISRFPKRCLKTSYTETSTFYSWPATKLDMIKMLKENIYEVSFIKNKTVLLNNIMAENESFTYLAISPSNLDVKEVEEYLAYSPSKVASDFGGTISLWIGCCFLTILEILEFLANCLASIRILLKKKMNKSNIEEPETLELDVKDGKL